MIQGQREALWSALNSVAPLKLAGGWDNVGVLLDPHVKRPQPPEREKILLTIDLTERVFQEALEAECSVIVAYHPIIFRGLKRLTQRDPQSRILLEAAQRGIGVYSPHTALDAVIGGVCDWLSAAALTPIDRSLDRPESLRGLDELMTSRALEPASDLFEAPSGAGRLVKLKTPQTLSQITSQLYTRVNSGLSERQAEVYLRRAIPGERDPDEVEVKRIALCPGAGGSLFESVRDVDLLITGEMRHHDVLARVHGGTSVILTEHTRCERGYLPIYARLIESAVGAEVICAQSDDDPLELYKHVDSRIIDHQR